MTDVERLLDALAGAGVDFVVIGGVAARERAKRAAGRAKDLLDLAEIADIKRRLGR